MKKWTAITDGGKYGVQPTMERPKIGDDKYGLPIGHDIKQYRKDLSKYEARLQSLPRYLRTQGLELLPDGEEFAGEIGYEVFNSNFTHELGLQEWWSKCSKDEYDTATPQYRRQVLAPLVKDQDVASVHQDSIVPCVAPVDTCNTDEHKSWESLFEYRMQFRYFGQFWDWLEENYQPPVPKVAAIPQTVRCGGVRRVGSKERVVYV